MHIPDAYLSPATQGACFVAMVPIWIIAAKKTRQSLTSKQAPLLSIGAAFCFAIQLFNIPALGGTTAHALGAGLLAILVGPWAAVLGMTISLTIQALLFGDGGVLSIGANSWNMAFIACLASYATFRLLRAQAEPGSFRYLLAAGVGAYTGTVLASASAALLLGMQPTIAHDALGRALYCPFGLGVSLPAMLFSHLLVAAPAEAIITVGTLGYLARSFPDVLRSQNPIRMGTSGVLLKRLLWILALSPLGLLATGSAWGEWDPSNLKAMIGYVPTGVANSASYITPLLPDYSIAGHGGRPWEIVGYLLSAVIGCVAIALFTRTIARRPVPINTTAASPTAPDSTLPAWLVAPNPTTSIARKDGPRLLERALLSLRETVARTIASEEIARKPGLLQNLNAGAKSVGFLGALIGIGLCHSPTILASLIGLGLLLGRLSHVPLRGFIGRVVGTVLFFGLIPAVPMALQAVTSGPVAFQMGPIMVSTTGLASAGLLLLRLTAGIGSALLWALTTRWHELLRSLRGLGVPALFVSTALLAYRYLFVVIETLSGMVEARVSRQVGAADQHQARVYAGTGSAILFAKSLAFTEEMHLAMLSRTVGIERPPERKWNRRDFATVLAGASLLAIVLLQGVTHVI